MLIAEDHLHSTVLGYLTGSLSADERTHFEEQLLADQEFSDAVATCEQEILDSYATGSLTPQETASLRAWIETSPRRMQRVRMAQALLRQRPAERRQNWRVAAILAAACLIGIVGAALHFLIKAPAREATVNSPLAAPLANGISPSKVEPAPHTDAKNPAVILLVAENMRGRQPVVTYRVQSDVPVELQIILAEGSQGIYNLEITSSGRSLVKREGLQPRSLAKHLYLDVSFPPGTFPPATYNAVISGEGTLLARTFVVTR